MILRDPFRWNRSPTVGQSFKFRYANPRGVDTANSVPIFHVSAQLVPEQGIVVGIRGCLRNRIRLPRITPLQLQESLR